MTFPFGIVLLLDQLQPENTGSVLSAKSGTEKGKKIIRLGKLTRKGKRIEEESAGVTGALMTKSQEGKDSMHSIPMMIEMFRGGFQWVRRSKPS